MTISAIPGRVRKATNAKLPLTARFDALLGLTFALNNWDVWMYDNEEYGEGGNLDHCIKCLGKAWKVC